MKIVTILLFVLVVALAYSQFIEPPQPKPTQQTERTQSKVYRNLSGVDGYTLVYETADGSPLVFGIRYYYIADTWAALRNGFSWVRHADRIYLPIAGARGILSVPEHMAPNDVTSNEIKVHEVVQDPRNFSREPTIITTTIIDESRREILATRERRIETGFSNETDSHAFVAKVLGAPASEQVEFSKVPMVITKIVPEDQNIPTGLPSDDYYTEVDGCDGSLVPTTAPAILESKSPYYNSRGIETENWHYLLKQTIIFQVFCRGDNIFIDLDTVSPYEVHIEWLRADGTFVGRIRTDLPIGYYRNWTRWIAAIELEGGRLTIDRRGAVHPSLRGQRKPTVVSAFIELDLTKADFLLPIKNEKYFVAN